MTTDIEMLYAYIVFALCILTTGIGAIWLANSLERNVKDAKKLVVDMNELLDRLEETILLVDSEGPPERHISCRR